MDDFKETILAIAERKLLHENAFGLCFILHSAISETLGISISKTEDLEEYIHTIFPDFYEALGITQWVLNEEGDWTRRYVVYPKYNHLWIPITEKLPRLRVINYLRQSL